MLNHLHVKNFKSLVDNDIPLSQLTLLTGVNSSGKSSVIQALRILNNASHSHLHFNEHINQYEGAITELCGHGSYSDLQSKEGSSGEVASIQFKIYDSENGKIEICIKDGKCVCIEHGFPLRYFNNIIYIGADRLGPQVFHSNEMEFENPIGVRGEHTYRFIASHQTETIFSPMVVKTEKQSLRFAINYWMSEISPGSELAAISHDNLDISSIEINGYRPTNIGFGMSYSLPIVTALLIYSNPSKSDNKKNLICIENPEAHLHPRAQTKMGELIARAAASGVQVIIETHSDHLLDGIRIAVKRGLLSHSSVELLFFEKEQGATKIVNPKLNEKGNIDHWPQGFFDQFMVNGSELLR
ncbi:MAG: hypothetical protein CVV46_14880 [Spirochaetae bacterium HGW-Spirochaetae-2]|nr:MAG: hypothetical protein CVV46_14880 [Spirochaetae bacterium HGW-Spirochaetae-2]